MDCIVKTSFGYELKHLYQYDKNQEVKIVLKPANKFLVAADIFESVDVHFYNSKSKKAIVVSGELERNTITVKIPDDLLVEGLDIYYYVYKTTEAGAENTIASGTIPVVSRIEFDKEEVNP